ncbi:hypothetical protein R1sor_020257 [Riccia sorocarpa]|uniref:CCAAT-binding factor domain-containing protein n=1 Tax=Riccia sorocarpa TaxID=122646 RepID=A0ABD3IIJ0_9MARC
MRPKPAKRNKSSKLLEETKQLGNDLLTSRSHVNNAPLLLSTLSDAKHSNAARGEALRSLQAFFVSLLRTGKLEPGAGTNQESIDGGNPEAIYKMWVRSKYQEFRKVVFRIASKEPSTGLQIEALNSCMDLVRDEKPGEFNNNLYFKLCGSMLRCKNETNDILEVLSKKYFQYADVRYYTYVNLETFISRRLQKDQQVDDEAAPSDEEDSDRKGGSLADFVRNAYDVLSSVPPPLTQEEKDGDVVYWRHSTDEGDNETSSVSTGEKRKRDQPSRRNKLKQIKPTNPKKQKSAFTKVWLSFLRLPLPLETYKKVLGELHKLVIPYMKTPLLLSDFLTLSYNVGGLISVMALSSLFVLITVHGLEYPDFYNKLYALLEPSIFVAKHRARFFELLDACLKSSHLPAYLAAAFTKRLGRLVLSAPPSGCIVVIALIHNLLRRHPSVNHLVHKDDSPSVVAPVVEDGANEASAAGIVSTKKLETEEANDKMVEGKRGIDPFRADEPDTTKTDALKSSLWEIDTLRRHYCPAVSRFVESLETDLTVRAKTTEMTISDFSSTSYATIFNEEVGRRLKTVPLAYYHHVPSTLFAESSFEGWSFQDEDVSHPKATQEPEGKDAEVMKDTTEVREETVQTGSEEKDGDEEEQEDKDSMDEEDSERYSEDSNGSRSRSEQSEGEGWPGPLLRFRDDR